MNLKPKYRTKQREKLLEYMKTAPGKHITARDVCRYFNEQGTPIGQATVYRQLECMVNEGIVNKYIIDVGSPACFEYIGEGSHEEEHCFHCKCEKCGRVIHLHCDEIAAIQKHLRAHHSFELNSMRTVFYGICEECCNHDE